MLSLLTFALALNAAVTSPQDTTTKVINLEPTVKVATLTRSVQRGDTLVFNAAAFKVSEDVEAGALLMKMPGIFVDGNRIIAQGEQVKKVYVDGMEYFGGDIGQVLQVIPANAIKNIEIFNRLSDDALLSGIDDGNGGKVINIVTKGDFSHSLFGKVNGGAGWEPDADERITTKAKYSTGGYINRFNGDRRWSILSLVNNVDKQNLSDENGMEINTTGGNNASSQFSVNREKGIGKAQILAFSYSDKFGKPFKEGRKTKKPWTIDATLFYVHDDIRDINEIHRFFHAPVAADTAYYLSTSNPSFHVARGRARIEYRKLKHSFLVVPSATFTDRDVVWGNSNESIKYGPSGYYNLYSTNRGHTSSLNSNVYTRYAYNFSKKVFAQFIWSTSYYYSDSPYHFVSNSGGKSTVSAALAPIKPAYSYRTNETYTIGTYIQPSINWRITPSHSVNLSTRIAYAPRHRELLLYDTDSTFVVNDPAGYRSRSSYDMDGNIQNNNVLLGWKFNKKKGWISLQAGYSFNGLMAKDNMHSTTADNWYTLPMYSFSTEWKFSPGSLLRINASSKVGFPNIWDMNDIYDLANTQFVRKGNMNLRPSNAHDFLSRYTKTFTDRGITMMFLARASIVEDFITDAVTYNPETLTVDGKKYHPVRINQRTNLPGYWSAGGEAHLGFPVDFLRSNLNMALQGNYWSRPEIINEEYLQMDKYNCSFQATLGSNISKYFDFTLSWYGSYNYNRNYLASLNSEHIFTKTTASLHAATRNGFTLNMSGYFSQTFFLGENLEFSIPYIDFTMWNLAVGKKVLGRHGEIQLCINDLFDTNKQYSRYTTVTYSQYRYDLPLRRYALLKFIYTIRQYK